MDEDKFIIKCFDRDEFYLKDLTDFIEECKKEFKVDENTPVFFSIDGDISILFEEDFPVIRLHYRKVNRENRDYFEIILVTSGVI